MIEFFKLNNGFKAEFFKKGHKICVICKHVECRFWVLNVVIYIINCKISLGFIGDLGLLEIHFFYDSRFKFRLVLCSTLCVCRYNFYLLNSSLPHIQSSTTDHRRGYKSCSFLPYKNNLHNKYFQPHYIWPKPCENRHLLFEMDVLPILEGRSCHRYS